MYGQLKKPMIRTSTPMRSVVTGEAERFLGQSVDDRGQRDREQQQREGQQQVHQPG